MINRENLIYYIRPSCRDITTSTIMTSRITAILFFFLSATLVIAQPASVKKSAKAVFSLNTFRADGTPLSTTHGIFVSPDGYGVSQWKPFVGAAKAFVTDADGKRYDVEAIVGANDLYDVCKFKVAGQTPYAPVAKASAAAGTPLWLACYKVKGTRLLNSSVKKVEPFSTSTNIEGEKEYAYYIVGIQTPENVLFTPFLNESGEVVAMLHTESNEGVANAVSAVYPSDMKPFQVGNSASTLSQSSIPTLLPEDYKDAQIALVMAGQNRTGEAYKAAVEYFIKKFRNRHDGYEARARINLSERKYSEAESDILKAIELSDDKADQHYSFSQLLLDKEVYMPEDTLLSWGLDRALEEAEKAYELKDSPIFLNQKAKVLTVMKRFDEACQTYLDLQATSLAGPENMLAATQCKKLAGASFEDVMALMDSTIAVCPKPLTYQSAPYVLQRAALYHEDGQYRKAVTEYNAYEKLMVGYNLRPDFYYTRFICEREGKLFQQALDDISKAIEIYPQNELYHCEKASLLLRLRMNDEAVAEANRALIINPENADAYAVLGVAQCATGKKHEGMLNLQRAKSLGHVNADTLIKKYE